MEQDIRVIPTTGRNNCGGRCVIKAHVKDGTIVRLTTDTPEEADGGVPLTACARGMNYHTTYLSDERLKYPMKRVGKRGSGEFARISWEEALDLLIREWVRIRDAYGPGSRYVMYATGESAVLSGRDLTKRLLALDGGFLDYYNSYSSACVRQITPYCYGTGDTGTAPRTGCIPPSSSCGVTTRPGERHHPTAGGRVDPHPARHGQRSGRRRRLGAVHRGAV